MLGMSSQASSYGISLLLIFVKHFVGHSFQNYDLFFNNIFCFIEFPNNSRFSYEAWSPTRAPFGMI